MFDINSAINENIISDNNLMFAVRNSIFNRCRRGRVFLRNNFIIILLFVFPTYKTENKNDFLCGAIKSLKIKTIISNNKTKI